MADTDVRRISGLESSEAIGKWPVHKPEDNTADFIKPILKIKKSTISVSASSSRKKENEQYLTILMGCQWKCA